MPDLLIDLDLYEEPKELAPPRRMSASASPVLRAIAAALTVALLLATGSAGGKPRPGVQQVADIAVPAEATLAALDGNLYLLQPGVLIALDPRSARQRWRVETDLSREFIRGEGDLIIVTGTQVTASLQRSPVRSLAIDVRTGEVRWSLTGDLTIADGYFVVHEISFAGIEAPGQVTVYDRAGKQIWSIPKEASWSSTVDSRRQTVFTLDPGTGELVEYRLDNGAVASRAVVPELVGAGGIGSYEGDVFVFFPSGGTLIREESGAFIAQGGDGKEESADCGMLWCVYSFGIKLIDKATGELVHHGQDWEMAISTDFGVIGIHGVYDYQPKAVSFVEPRSRRVQRLTNWSPVGPPADSRVVRWHGPLFFVANAPPRTYFGVLDSTSIRIAGSVPYEHLPQCAATVYLVVCRVSPKNVRAWHPE